jgi:hypothetical protein
MGFLIAVVLFVFVFFLIKQSSRNLLTSTAAIDRLARRGIRGRGLVLSSFQMSFGVTLGGRRFERKQMTLDVEIPGRPPYQINGQFLIPRGQVEAIPGSSLEVAVDPSNPSQIAVLGPGGFTGPWLNLGPPNAY